MADDNHTYGLRYVGARFHDARLPVDVLSDLPAFRDLLVSFAKDHWRTANADRKRLPKGFDKSISFDLVAIKEGSAIPQLEWNRGNAQHELPGFADQLSEVVSKAYEEVLGLIIAAANDNVPANISSDKIRALNRFGAGLRDGEKIEFSGSRDNSGNVVYLDGSRRRKLITKGQDTYIIRYESVGRLLGSSIDEAGIGGSIYVQTDNHGTLNITLDAERIQAEFDGNIGGQVQFDLMVQLDKNDVVKSVVDAFDVDLIGDDVVADLDRQKERLLYLKQLSDGWLNGDGNHIAVASIEAVESFLHRRPFMAGSYSMFPMEAGGISIEFKNSGWDYSVEFHHDGSVEMFGVQIDGPEEMEPEVFDEVSDEFFSSFDKRMRGNF